MQVETGTCSIVDAVLHRENVWYGLFFSGLMFSLFRQNRREWISPETQSGLSCTITTTSVCQAFSEEIFRENRVGSLAVQMLSCVRLTCEYQRRPAEQ